MPAFDCSLTPPEHTELEKNVPAPSFMILASWAARSGKCPSTTATVQGLPSFLSLALSTESTTDVFVESVHMPSTSGSGLGDMNAGSASL